MKTKTNQNEKQRYRKKIPYTIRYITIAIITLLLLISLFNVYSAYQTQTTTIINTPVLNYEHQGRFDYTIFLLTNTLYENKTFLRPEEGPFFRQLIDHINASFIYSFQTNQTATIQGHYTIDAVLQTNFWEKTYPLIERTLFSAQGKRASFNVNFPVNYTHYEHIYQTINDETGVAAQNPRLRFQANIVVSVSITNKTTTSFFSPSIDMALGQKTIEFSETLTTMLPGTITEEMIIEQPEVINQRNTWIMFLAILFIALPLFLFFTTDSKQVVSKTEKEIRKIKKKYGEWIVETQTPPKHSKTNVIIVNSLEDLSKVSEELGKPILLYHSSKNNMYQFYVLEDHLMYQYELKSDEKKNKVVAICPKCNKVNYYKGLSGEKIPIVCSNCGNQGIISVK